VAQNPDLNRNLFPLKLEQPAVLLFGAGASRGGLTGGNRLSPPVDKDFFSLANRIFRHGTPTIAHRVLRSVWELYKRIEGIGLEQYYRDIETRAVIAKIAPSANKPKDWTRRQNDLEELIRRVYIHTSVDLSRSPPVARIGPVHEYLLGILKPRSTVVTFNYDMILEESFKSAKLWNPSDGYGVRVVGQTFDWCRRWLVQRGNPPSPKSRIHLLKLHGSLGWTLYKNRMIRLKARPYYVRKGKREKISVLPPGWNKRIQVNPYRIFWREARLRMERCKALVIIGYSLPDTDLLARSLFAEVGRMRSARHNFLRQLVLVDPDDGVRSKLADLLTPALGPCGRVLRFNSLEDCMSLR